MNRRALLLGSACTLGAPRLSRAAATGWQPDPKLLAELERKKTTWIYREADVPPYTVPDPLRVDGRLVRTRDEWETVGRPATLELFRKHVYGRQPAGKPEMRYEVFATDPRAMDGKATLKRVRITSTLGGKSFTFPAAVFLPNGSRAVNAFLLINNRAESSADPTRAQKNGFWPAEDIVARGYAAAVFRTVDVDPDANGPEARAKGVRGVWPEREGNPGEAWGTLAAWAWGASRVLDYLLTLTEPEIERVAVVGHSRGGKTALWAGAEDTRFALAVSNDSGCGGAALSRRIFGETVQAINRGFPYWFCDNFKKFDGKEADLPVDQHQLLALLAPRGVYVASADADFWADQRGEFLALAYASPVFALYGSRRIRPDEMPALEKPLVRRRMGYHIRPGTHNLTPYDWSCFMDFADRLRR